MGRRWVRRTLWLAVGIVVVVGIHLLNRPVQATTATTGGAHAVVDLPGYSSNGTLSKPTADDLSQVTRDLDRQAGAVLSGDRKAFLSAVDTDRAAFLASQRTAWANTQKLHFDTFAYHVGDTVEPDRLLHTPSLVVRVTTTYQIHGFDTSPIELDDGFTFVRQHGAWKLAGVSDADSQFDSDQLPAPWEGPAIDAYGDHDYLAIVDRGRLPLAHQIVALCHAASAGSGSLLGVANDTPTVVLATSHTRGFNRFTGPDAEAAAFGLKTSDGTATGWRMVLNPHYVDLVVRDPIVLTHELTHLAMQSYLRDLPSWLAEGSAEYVGWHGHGGLAEAAQRRRIHPVRLPDRIPVSSDFYLDHVQLNYVQGQALVSYLVSRYGVPGLVALLHAYADAGRADVRFDPDLATPHLLHRVLGTSSRAVARAAYAPLLASS